MSARVIDTRYRGFRFRSRLEARWAVFFDELCIKWEYEAEGFALPSGNYLPDFWLPDLKTWIEVKRSGWDSDTESRRFDELLVVTQKRGMIVAGEPFVSVEIARGNLDGHAFGGAWRMRWAETDETESDWSVGSDCPYLFCVCLDCGRAGIEFDGRGHRVCGSAHGPRDDYKRYGHPDKGYSGTSERVVGAAVAARAARFEFGEQVPA